MSVSGSLLFWKRIIMWSSIQTFFSHSAVSTDVILSLAAIFFLIVFRMIVLFVTFKRNSDWSLDTKRRWVVVSRNVIFLVSLLALFMIWSTQIQNFALSMVAFAAAMVLATKELIMCLSGSLLRASTRLYSVGDYIKVGDIKGRVIDINILNTVMMEVGLNNYLTGHTISFSNSVLLTQNVSKDAIFGPYVAHYFEIPMSVNVNPEGAVNFIQDKILQYSSPYIHEAERHFQALKVEKLYLIPSVEPLVKIMPLNDKLHHLAIRLVIPFKERQRIEQEIIRAFLLYQYHQENSSKAH